jgi:hypothetical protein
MLLKHPDAELTSDSRLADALNDLHAPIPQDEHPSTVHTRVRITHSDHDSGDTAFGDRL